MLKEAVDMLIGPKLPPPPRRAGDSGVQGPAGGESSEGALRYALPAAAALALGSGALLLAKRRTR